MELTLIVMRHGQTSADLENRHEGRADNPLTDLGEKQVKASIEKLTEDYKLDRIYTSPLKRAKKTAEFLQLKTKAPLIEDVLLMEWDNGKLAGMDREEADRVYPLPSGGRRQHHEFADSESGIYFRARAETFLSNLLEDQEGKTETIVIVSHGGFIQMLFRSVFQLPFETNHFISTGDGGYHVWVIKENKRTQKELFPGH